MKIIRTLGLVAAATAAVAGVAGPAFGATPAAARTVDNMKAKVDSRAEHITAKLQVLQSQVATEPKLAPARATLQADITKALADTAAWRRQADAATTKAGVRAADPAHAAVKADLAKLRTDLAAAKGARKTAR